MNECEVVRCLNGNGDEQRKTSGGGLFRVRMLGLGPVSVAVTGGIEVDPPVVRRECSGELTPEA